MHAREIKSQLVLKGRTMAEFARQFDLSLTQIRRIVASEQVNEPVQRAIAKAIGRSVSDVFEPLPTPRKKRRVA